MRRALSIVLGLVLVLVATVSPVAAAKPTIVVDEVDASFVDEFLTEECGFEVMSTVQGRVIHKEWTDAEGNVVRELHNIAISRTLSANGNTIRLVDRGVDRVIFHEDGSRTLFIIGNLSLTTLPGQGVAQGAAGRIVLLITPVLDEEGNPVLDEEGFPIENVEVLHESGVVGDEDVDDICGYLAA